MNEAVLISDWTKESQDLYDLSCPQRLIDDLMDSDLKKYIPALNRAHLTDAQKAEIGALWAEGMECGALCFYYWMYDNPHIRPDESARKGAWKLFPQLEIDTARAHLDDIASASEYIDDHGNPAIETLQRYTYENFEWAVFHVGPYYVLEAYFSH